MKHFQVNYYLLKLEDQFRTLNANLDVFLKDLTEDKLMLLMKEDNIKLLGNGKTK